MECSSSTTAAAGDGTDRAALTRRANPSSPSGAGIAASGSSTPCSPGPATSSGPLRAEPVSPTRAARPSPTPAARPRTSPGVRASDTAPRAPAVVRRTARTTRSAGAGARPGAAGRAGSVAAEGSGSMPTTYRRPGLFVTLDR